LEGPDLEATLNAGTEQYTWDSPEPGVSTVKLIASDENGDEIGSLETKVNVTCGEDQADLAVITTTFVPTAPVAHLPVTVTVEIENQGAAESGGFAAAWWHLKTAQDSTCQWVLPEGLAPGETRALSCTVLAYGASYAQLVTMTQIDSTDIIAESDEDNNAWEATISVLEPKEVYDFVEHADVAAWSSGLPTEVLPWPGTVGDEDGYARLTDGSTETGGAIQGLCLETHPRVVEDGFVRGEYEAFLSPGYEVAPGDHFEAVFSLLEGSDDGAVSFRVMLILSEVGGQWIVNKSHQYGDGVETVSVDLTPYAGQEAAVILQVDAGASATEDRACWLEGRIYRYP
jgi:hypothetical protein